MAISILAAAALFLVLLAAMLWLRAQRQGRRREVKAFLERQIHRGIPASMAAESELVRLTVLRSGVERWDVLLRCAGIRQTPALYAVIVAILCLGALLAWLLAGPVSAIAAGIMLTVAMYFYLWLRADRRRNRMFDQLPEMLDTMVRLITIGNSMAAAFQDAAASTAAPLKEVVEKAAQLSRSTQELDAALSNVARQYGFDELHLLAAVVRVAQKYGGRSDVVLERIGAFMRDLAQARSELVAASAEIRLSAWVLALMPLGIAGYIMLTNNAMFMDMWDDALGFKMLMMAAALQVAGSYWLYRMTKSI